MKYFENFFSKINSKFPKVYEINLILSLKITIGYQENISVAKF